MSDTFHEVRFPTNIKYQSVGGPEFNTEVIEFGNGHEQRNINWEQMRERWNVAYGMDTVANCSAVVEFFYARRGKAYGFRFKNHDDYQATDEVVGEGDGVTTGFQLVKTYTSGGETFTRTIRKPVTGTAIIYEDTAVAGGVTVNSETGLVSFSVAPSSGVQISATFEFDIPVRFDVDYLPENFETYQVRSIDVPIVELKNP